MNFPKETGMFFCKACSETLLRNEILKLQMHMGFPNMRSHLTSLSDIFTLDY